MVGGYKGQAYWNTARRPSRAACGGGTTEDDGLKTVLSRILTAAVLAVGLAGAAGVPAADAVVKAQTTPDQQQVLSQAERYINSIGTLQARFLQLSSTGHSVEGDVFMHRPGRMRLEYEDAPILMVANGRHLIYVDQQLDQVSYLGLDQTPVGVLLRPNVSFADPDITVTAVRRASNVAEIDVVQTKDPGAGMLTLVFTEQPFELRQWRVRDAQNVETAVSLFNARTGMDLPGSLFQFSESRDRLNPMGRK